MNVLRSIVLGLICLVSVPALAQPVVTAVRSGATIQVTMTGGPGHIYDWITIVPTSSSSTTYTGIWFMSGTSMPPSSPLTQAQFLIATPTTNGIYEVRWLASGHYDRIATSAPIYIGVTPPAPPAPLPGTILFDGDSNTATYYISGAENWTAIAAQGLGYSETINNAVAGRYASGVLANMPTIAASGAAACVVMIGTNDMANAVATGVNAGVARANYAQTMRQIITGLKTSCSKAAIISPPMPMKAREVARLDGWVSDLRDLTSEIGVAFFDLFGHMKALSAVKTPSAFDSFFHTPGVDFYHLSVAGHAMLADFVIRSGRLTP